jgi:hypothetical protein
MRIHYELSDKFFSDNFDAMFITTGSVTPEEGYQAIISANVIEGLVDSIGAHSP